MFFTHTAQYGGKRRLHFTRNGADLQAKGQEGRVACFSRTLHSTEEKEDYTLLETAQIYRLRDRRGTWLVFHAHCTVRRKKKITLY